LISAMRVRKREFQQTLSGELLPIWIWEFLGIRSAVEVGDPSGEVWVLEFGADEFDKLVRGRH
jgi:hypothetical protein